VPSMSTVRLSTSASASVICSNPAVHCHPRSHRRNTADVPSCRRVRTVAASPLQSPSNHTIPHHCLLLA
jgi:hypothetical protein